MASELEESASAKERGPQIHRAGHSFRSSKRKQGACSRQQTGFTAGVGLAPGYSVREVYIGPGHTRRGDLDHVGDRRW